MRIASLVCLIALTFTSLACQAAADSASLQSKCQEQLAAGQDEMSKAKQLAQLAGNDKASDTLASVDGGCERLNAEVDNAAEAAGQSKLNQAASDVDAAKEQLKGLGSMFGK